MVQLTSLLKLVVRDECLADSEVKCSNAVNVGWAAEIVDDWNAVGSSVAKVESHKSTLQSADSSSSLLQCGMFCMSDSVSLLYLHNNSIMFLGCWSSSMISVVR